MKKGQGKKELKPSTQASPESEGEQKNVQPIEAAAPIQESGSGSGSSNDGRKVSRKDIELVQNLIERCLQLYMTRDEVVKTLLNRARIAPGFTTLVWQKLEEENADFFRWYYIRLKLKKQIIVFNNLLEHQYHLMKYPPIHAKVPLAPIQNGIHHPMLPGVSAVTSMPMGYPILQLPHMHVPGHPHLEPMARGMPSGMPSGHVVNGVPAPAAFQPMRMNSGNDMVIDTPAANDTTAAETTEADTTEADTTEADPAPMLPPNDGGMASEMQVSPASVASSGHFPFAPSEMSGMGMETSALDSAFTSDVGTSAGLQLGSDVAGCSRDAGPFDQIPWNFSLSDLTADLSNLGDLGDLGNYPGSPFLPSDSELLLDSPEQDDIDEFFVDSLPDPPCSTSDEDNKFFMDSLPDGSDLPCSQSDADKKP